MNDKSKTLLKSLWEKFWNEPRHFFFWVVLLSPLLYMTVLSISGLAGSPPPLIQWVALAAILGFLLGIPAFVLSWIPPIRRVFARLLQRKFFVLTCLVTLVALFYAEENWRGRSAWNRFRQEWEARGVEFELSKIVPPPVPAAENMFEAEPWNSLHFTKTNGGAAVFENPDVQNAVWFDCDGPNRREAPEGTDVFLARPANLAEWQQFYRGTNNQFAGPNGTATNYFPIASAPQTPAKDVLLALSKFDDRLAQVRSAAQRPKARFWINMEDGFAALLPHLSKFRGVALYLRLRSTALLADGQSDAALEEIMLSFRVVDALRNEPTLISQLVRIAGMHLTLSAVWEGLAAHRWNEAQLATIEQELAKTDLLADYQTGMAGERYCGMWTVDFVHRTGDVNALGGSGEPQEHTLGDEILAANGKILLRLVPSGWFDQNKLSLERMHVDYIRPMVNDEKQLVPPASSRRAAKAVKSFRPTPYDLFTGMLVPALEKAARKAAIAQTYVNLARVAIALERYRLANSSYPENLEVLAPKFIDNPPHDVINGQPLKYRRNADGSFLLYSIGWNETDDGGKVVRKTGKDGKAGAVNQDEGDWVWRYPAE